MTIHKLDSIILNPKGSEVDRMGWMDLAGGVFSVRSTYELATGGNVKDGWPGRSRLR